MAVFKLRGLGSLGILADPDPFDLPPSAFSAGVNIRFHDGRASRGPVQRVAGRLPGLQPRTVFASPGSGGAYDSIFVGTREGRVLRWTPSSLEDRSPTDYVDSAAEDAWTTTRMGEVLYANRPDRVPWALTPDADRFAPLANWNPGWRAGILRSYMDALVALNVTKGGTSYPTMIKVSDQALSGAVPATWDEADPTANTYENVITEMTTGIVDGLPLRDAFVIYGSRETCLMQATGDNQVYAVRTVFRDAGAISTNCVIEIDSKHYVFGPSDIWVHDGLSKQSISNGRVRKFIYRTMDSKRASSCFVAHNAYLKELHFCFVSGNAAFPGGSSLGCNKAAVYNYAEDKWSFDDLPMVYASCQANADTVMSWDSASATWETIGGAWLDQDNGLKQGLMYVGEAHTDAGLQASVYVNDLYGEGSLFGFPVDPLANPAATLERGGIDLDEVGEELRGYKVVRALYPQGRLDSGSAPLEFAFGSTDGPNEPIVWSDWMTYDGADLYKLDYRAAGRFLSMRLRYQDYKAMSLSGIDLDLVVLGRR